MYYRLKWLSFGILAGLFCLMLSSLFSNDIHHLKNNLVSQFEQNEKIITVGRGADSLSLDPSTTIDMESARVAVNLFEGLVAYENNEIVPSLAKRWTVSEDGLTWRFYLQRGVTFHDGTPFNGEAVEFNFDRWMNPESPYHSGDFQYWNVVFGTTPSVIKSVHALSENVVEFELNKPFAPFLGTLAMPAFSMSSPEAIVKYHENIKYNPVGTGPFQFKSWNDNGTIVLERNMNYWKKPALVSTIVYKTIDNSHSRVHELIQGDIQILSNLTLDEERTLAENDDFLLIRRPLSSVGYLFMNLSSQTLSDRNIRQAIYAQLYLDMASDPLFTGFSKPASAFLPPGIWGAKEGLSSMTLNTTEIQTLLEPYDLSHVRLKLLLTSDRRPYFPEPQRMADFVKNAVEKLGITVEVVELPWSEFLPSLDKRDYDLLLTGWVADVLDPDNFLYTFFSSDNISEGSLTNYSMYKNAEVDKRLALARQTTDQSFRESLYMEIQDIIYSDMPAVPLTSMMTSIAINKSVLNFQTDFIGLERFGEADIIKEAPDAQ